MRNRLFKNFLAHSINVLHFLSLMHMLRFPLSHKLKDFVESKTPLIPFNPILKPKFSFLLPVQFYYLSSQPKKSFIFLHKQPCPPKHVILCLT